MTGFDDLARRLTRRLRVDPELRMDVARELRAHLEDSAEEFRRGGFSEQEAADKAVQALGDETALAEQLWDANRRRIRFRQAAKWAARVALVPAAVAVVLLIITGCFHILYGFGVDTWPWAHPADRPGLTAEQRFILRGDPKDKDSTEALKSISQRWPDDPVYYANYAGVYLPRLKLPEALAVLDRGEQIEPDNAFYNFFKAALLVEASSELTEDPDRSYQVWRGSPERPTTAPYHRVRITDAPAFQRGIAEFLRGAGKPRCTGHAVDLLDRRMSILPKDRRLSDHLGRLAMELSMLLPPLSKYRALARSVDAHALDLARQGRVQEAARLVRAAEVMGAKIGADAQSLIELLTASAVYDYALTCEELLYSREGRPEQAARAEKMRRDEDEFWLGLRDSGKMVAEISQVRPGMGLLWQSLMPGIPGYAPGMNFEPMRSAEQAVADQAALVVLLVLILLVLGIFELVSLTSLLLNRGRPEGPKLFFVGWRRMGRICLLAVAIPLAGFAAYAYLPLGRRHYGLNVGLVKALVEYALTATVVLALLLRLSYEAVRRRAADAGMIVPAPWRLRRRKIVLGVGAAAMATTVVYLATWPSEALLEKMVIAGTTSISVQFMFDWFGVALLAGIPILGLLWGFRELVGMAWMRGELAHFRRTFFRSAAPILASAVIVVGAFCGLALAGRETAAVGRVQTEDAVLFRNEVVKSDYRLLKERLAERHRALLEEGPGWPTTQPASARASIPGAGGS